MKILKQTIDVHPCCFFRSQFAKCTSLKLSVPTTVHRKRKKEPQGSVHRIANILIAKKSAKTTDDVPSVALEPRDGNGRDNYLDSRGHSMEPGRVVSTGAPRALDPPRGDVADETWQNHRADSLAPCISLLRIAAGRSESRYSDRELYRILNASRWTITE
ncbi:hypothetical protein K0M31_014762 [Melipona bicolor]|uniref:Uncharacterized protein n=1 Tax=Melipona bicolor TaxID=60889 RepID=A0AA40FGT9_9HYME|nr:hypothetical protein K0M31_014762 [Melipona bicolor]